jgi:hypothetical protein
MRATRVLLSWTTKVSRRPRRLLPLVGRFNFFRSEQEDIIRTFKAENDASDRKICLYLNILMGGFTLLSVPIFCCLLPSPLNPQAQTCHISHPKNKPTQPLSFTRSTSTDSLRHSIHIGSYRDPARAGGSLHPRKRLRFHDISCKIICNHLSCTHVLRAYRTRLDQYRMVELRLCSGSYRPFLPFTYCPGPEKHIAARGNEV